MYFILPYDSIYYLESDLRKINVYGDVAHQPLCSYYGKLNELPQALFENGFLRVGQLGLGAVLPDGQGLGSPVILLVQNGIQTAGQLAVQVALEDIAGGAERGGQYEVHPADQQLYGHPAQWGQAGREPERLC